MPIMKVTFIFECRNKGWSESYYRNFPSSDPSATPVEIDPLATARMGVAGKEVTMTYYRVADIATPRKVRLFYLGQQFKGVASRAADNPESSLILKFTDATGGRAKTTFLRGYWDSVVDEGGNYDPINAFTDNLDDFIAKLKDRTWGWLGISTAVTQPLATLVQDAAGTVSGTLGGNLFPLPSVGGIGPVRFKRITQPGNLNGQNPVFVVSQTAFKTVKRIAILPWSGDGAITLNTKNIVQIDRGSITGVSERKTGRVFGSPRGRLPARKRA
jgi:hypothetical protein